MKIMLKWTESNPRHRRVSVFVGPTRESLALAGRLTLSHDEAVAFRYTVRQGIMAPGFSGIFESGWPDE